MLEHPSDEAQAEKFAFVKNLMQNESTNLLDEIARLEQNRSMQDKRLKNVMDLVCLPMHFCGYAEIESRLCRHLAALTWRTVGGCSD
jgi:hypothetical protein